MSLLFLTIADCGNFFLRNKLELVIKQQLVRQSIASSRVDNLKRNKNI